MKNEIVEISELQAKRLILEARKKEQEAGVSLEEIVLRILYESENDQARVDAARLYYAVTYNSGLDLDSLIEEPNIAEVLSIKDE